MTLDELRAASALPAPDLPSPTPPPALSVDSVHKRFAQVHAVAGASLEARAGEIVGLLGPNGAGKTTLLRMVVGMIRPDEGRVTYALDGTPTPTPTLDARLLGYLPEDRGLYTDATLQRVLVYFATLRGMARPDAGREADRWLERLGLADRAGEQVRALSKGNQQKVQFISTVLHRPRLVVLDEPFSGLDPLNQDFFLGLIRELRDAGAAVVLSAHQMQLVERVADRITLLRDGSVVDEGSVDALRARWGAGRRLVLRLGGDPDVSFLEGLSGVEGVAAGQAGRVEVALAAEADFSRLLATLGNRLEILDLGVHHVTLHDIYVDAVGPQVESDPTDGASP